MCVVQICLIIADFAMFAETRLPWREKMNKIKANWALFLFVGIVFIVFNIFAFMLSDEYNAHFWCGYGIVVVGWLCILVVSILSIGDKKDRYLLNAPIILISIVHFVAQLIVAIAVISISSFSIKVAICISILLLAIYIIATSGLIVYKNRVNKR